MVAETRNGYAVLLTSLEDSEMRLHLNEMKEYLVGGVIDEHLDSLDRWLTKAARQPLLQSTQQCSPGNLGYHNANDNIFGTASYQSRR